MPSRRRAKASLLRTLLLTPSANAHSLLAGGPVASVRRRLKVGSLLYDRVALESGVYRAQAGPGGSTHFRRAFHPNDRPGWQTARERAAATGKTFTVAVGIEASRGVPATTMRPVLASESQIRWEATLDPFSLELPEGCDWVEWVGRPPRIPELVSRAARRWSDLDERNKVLAEQFPARSVRSRIINDTNDDLALAAAQGWVLSADPLHSEVISSRLGDQEGWRLEGFALPILVPAVGDLPWDAIVELRRHQGLRTLRSILREAEAAALETACSRGDLEATVRRHISLELGRANEAVDSLGATIRKTVVGLAIATGTGFAFASVTGPIGVLLTAGASTTLGGVIDVRAAGRSKKSRAWIGAFAKIETAAEK